MRTFLWRLRWTLPILLFSLTIANAQTDAQKAQIKSGYDQTKLSTLQVLYKNKAEANKLRAIQLAKQNGWEVSKLNSDGTIDELVSVSPDGRPVYYTIYNDDAAISTRAVHLNTGGNLGLNLDGQNMTAHVWDGGATRVTHQEFDGPGGTNRVTVNDGVTSLNGNSFHAQHVTGTIVASGVQPAAKGMAWQARALTHDWNNDLAEATTEAANGMLVSNHSYGFRASLIPDWYFGAYIDESRDWDNLMYNSPNYLMVVAAGNDGNDNSSNGAPLNGASAYDKLSGHSTSKNNMVVANAQDANVASDGTLISVLINSGSSEGPTDDLRIKPDIAGNGTGLYSTYDNSDVAYNSISGTSMASPNVAGSLLLLQQHYNNVNGSFMRSSTLKGVALHTADDAGPSGPDVVYGWGLMNSRAAAQAISQSGNESLVSELTLSPGQTYTTTVDSDGTSPLLASISWTDPAGTANTGTTNLTTPVLVNDLDIRVTQGGSTFTPYRLTAVNANGTGDNTVDPFERVDVGSASGTYTITVTHKGSLSGGSQNFALVVTGLTGTPVVCNATTPSGLAASNVSFATATLSWNAVPAATYDVRYRQVGTSTWTTNAVSGATTSLSGLTPETQYEAQVRSKCSGGSTSAYSSSVTFTTTQFQLTYCASNGQSTADEYIGRVQLGSIDNASGAGSGGYTDHTSISTDLTKGSSASITITPTWSGTVYSEGYAVWIDYNQDGDFEDAGETVFTQAATQTTPVSGSFTVPASATDGATRMRVSMKYNATPTSCESFQYGEVEDYTVNITTGGGGGPGGCTGGISSFPYGESFESGDGWTQVTGDDGNWVRDSGGTPSGSTGPSNGADGSFYMFLEASTNNSPGQIGNNATAILESDCFDLSGETSATFSFAYHMYGSNIGSLTIQSSDDDGATWSNEWTLSGNQGNSWQSASVSLDAFAGGDVKLRIVGTTGPGWQSDIAVDDLSVTVGGGGGGPSCPAIDFNSYTISSFATQDSDGTNSIGGGGSSLTLTNNTWKSINLSYTVTANTVIEFDFNSTSQGEIHGIAFENDNTLTSTRVFKVHGTQNYGNTTYDNYTSGTVTYTIPVGSSYTGSMDRLVFINDNDAGTGNNGTFSNVKIYEGTCGTSTTSYVTFDNVVNTFGTEDELEPMAVSVYPVPATGDVLNVAVNRTDVSFNIINVSGQMVSAGTIENGQVNIGSLSEGLYVIRLEAGAETKTIRFMKK